MEEQTQERPVQSDIEPIGDATYCPEDDKLRLYVGRVPRDEYLALKKEGWTSTPKQDCDFVATWSPKRHATALHYSGGFIADEDQSPDERAIDRAERFGGYRDKRLQEATGHADRYDAGPQVHGYQSAQRAERAAARHDRIATHACDAWSKAEYWTTRTAGVIRHALHKSSPGVRMGRIKTIEAEIRRMEAQFTPNGYFDQPDGKGNVIRYAVVGLGRAQHPVEPDKLDNIRAHYQPWLDHLRLRLAYENQMLEAQGGRLEQMEVQAGGKLGGKLILRVNKSTATGRATSAVILGPKIDGWHHMASNIPGTEFAEHRFDLERLKPDAYTPPTPESLEELKALKSKLKAAKKAASGPTCPLINPTIEDAERLQAIWNAQAKQKREQAVTYYAVKDFVPAPVIQIRQATYAAASKGAYARAETRGVRAGGARAPRKTNLWTAQAAEYEKRTGPDLCKIRIDTRSTPPSIIVLTDKPQKPLPSAIWQEIEQPALL